MNNNQNNDTKAAPVEVKLTGVRKAIATAMYDSLRSMAQTSDAVELDVTKLVTLRKSLVARADELGCKITINDLLSFAAVKVMEECFPGGSITGAPKIRAMEIIEELEGLKRNIYTGAIGYFDFRGNSDFNIAIRTILKKDNKAYFGVGGGITYESIEEDEYLETLDKAKALMKVL